MLDDCANHIYPLPQEHLKLEEKLGIVEMAPVERVLSHPTAENLSEVPKFKQTYEMLMLVCSQDGRALRFASKKLITKELCLVAVNQNGLALHDVPPEEVDNGRSIRERLDRDIVIAAVQQNGLALRACSSLSIDKDIVLAAVKQNGLALEYVPAKYIDDNLILTSVNQNGLALKYVPVERITKELVFSALDNNIMAIRYAPKKLLAYDDWRAAFEKDSAVFSCMPLKYATKTRCMKVISDGKCFVFKPDARLLKAVLGDEKSNYIVFDDLPEKLRNDKDVLQVICDRYKYGSIPLLKWNDSVANSYERFFYREDKRGNVIRPLLDETVEFLNTLKKNPDVYGISNMVPSDVELPSSEEIPDLFSVIPLSNNGTISHNLSETDTNDRDFYYVSDIHLEHQIAPFLKEMGNEAEDNKTQFLEDFVREKIREMIPLERHFNDNDILLIGGDVADSIPLCSLFYKELRYRWGWRSIISVLGNHELWDGTSINEWNDSNYVARPVDEIINDYKQHLRTDFLLENELVVWYKDRSEGLLVSEEMILTSSKEELTEFLSKCTLIVLGGIGYSGLNPAYNAGSGLYRKAIVSVEEDMERSARFRRVYDVVYDCAYDRKVIVLTHNPVYDWSDVGYNPNWIYVNGHTHKNAMLIESNGTTILSDNQIGYEPAIWKLNSFNIDVSWYDPFVAYKDGIYQIASEEYKAFNRGRGIFSNGCSYEGKLFMLKRDSYYMFLLESSTSLCLMAGGRRKKLPCRDINYYYNNMLLYTNLVNASIEPYQRFMKSLSDEVKSVGGVGTIHGCIVDISFFSHIYINPFDGKITYYWAPDICSRKVYKSFKSLLEQKEPTLLNGFHDKSKEGLIPLIAPINKPKKTPKSEIALPEWMFGTEIYEPSRIMRAVQYVWEKNVIRIWNDDVLQAENSAGILGARALPQCLQQGDSE